MRRFKKEHALITALLLLWHMLLLPITVWAADEPADGIQIELRSTQSLVDSGNKFTYEISYSVSSTTKLFTDAEIVLPLPKELVFASAVDAGDTNYAYDAALHTVTFKFKDAVRAGTTGTVQVIVYFPNYTTPDGTAVSASGKFLSGQGSKTSNAVTVTARASAEWELKKERTKPVQEVLPEPGGEVEYKLTLRDKKLSASGRLELRDAVVRDTLPAEAQFVSATPAADKVENGQVIWNLGTLGQGVTSKELRVLVKYPSTASGLVTNTAEAAYTPLQQSPVTLHAEVQHGFTSSPEDGGSGFFKSVQDRQKEASPGQDVNFYIGSLYSRANVSLQNYEVTDMTPDHLELLQIFTPTFTGIDSYKIQYTVADSVYGPWNDWKTVRTDQRQTLKVSELPVPGSAVRGFKLVYGTVPVNFNQTGNFEIRYKVDPVMPASAVPDETAKTTNTAGLRYSFAGSLYEENRSADLYIVQNRPLLEVVKKALNGTDFSPGDTVHYQISVRNSEYSSMDFQNPIIEDLLPPELEYVPDSARLTDDSGLGLSAPVFELGTGTDGRSLLRWSWSDGNPAAIGLSKKIVLEYEAKIKAGTKSGYVDNVAEVTSDRHDYLNNADFTKKIYKNGRWYDYNNAPVYVHSTVKLESVKWVQGDLDGNNWTQYPSKGLTTPGGKVEYRLQVTNVGNIAVKGLLIVDALPRIGDLGVVDRSSRDSGWSPVLTGKVVTPNYITAYYSTDADIAMSGGHWSMEPPGDLTKVTGLKFMFSDGHVIAPGAQEEVGWVMRAPVNAPTDGQTAWSSFGYTAQRVDNGKSLLTTEPLKVGVVVQEDAEGEIGNYVWRDANGDGVQNETAEQGVNGVHVELYNASGALVQSTITSNDFAGNPGYYMFTHLSSGSYRVKFNLPEGYGGWVKANQTADASDSDADADGWSEMIQLGAGQRNTDIDAGLLLPQGRIGDKVWLDTNGNGLQDAGEPGQDGAAVRLFDANGFVLAETVTSGGGIYAFEHLPAGSYFVQFDLPAGYRFTQQGDGSQRELDSNPDPAAGRTGLIALGANESNNTVDAGLLAPSASLGNRVWLDENKNGLQDGAEPGLNGLTVELLNERGEAVQTAKTVKDTVYGDGFYRFGSLWAGAYQVRFTLPEGSYAFTVQGKDAASDQDSNADTASGVSGIIRLAAGEANDTVDAGIIPLPPEEGKAALGDYVWLDENGDAVQNDGDSGVNGIVVKLYNDRGALQASTITASVYQSVYNSVYSSVYSSPGYYQFSDLTPGSYIVQFGLPDGYAFTGKGAGGNSATDSDAYADGMTDRIALASGQTDLSIDAGLRRLSVPPVLGMLGDYVWDDKNGDGVQNDGEPGIGGVTVRLLDERGQQLAEAVTDSVYGSLGRYRFDELSAGQYRIKFELPSGYAFTLKGAGDNRSADSDALPDGTTDLHYLDAGADRSVGRCRAQANAGKPGTVSGARRPCLVRCEWRRCAKRGRNGR
ncbi:SdrD B-like domain-containing protein [Paenibacillus sp. TAB 01]|uniref:SdrD B-like domain-containing protein n=1 Tax=Paenibacillus sp. TAB 01 TaxID=3368988 RepID=UPI0037529DFA